MYYLIDEIDELFTNVPWTSVNVETRKQKGTNRSIKLFENHVNGFFFFGIPIIIKYAFHFMANTVFELRSANIYKM